MPIPTKNIDETNEEFIERCMADDTMVEEYEDDQRLAICSLQLEEDRALEDINTKPTQEMADEAAQGLEWREEFGRGGTEVGVARARDIKNRVNLSIKSIKRMYSYFSRHEVDKEGQGFYSGDEGYPSAGRIAWALWGGDVGFAWTKRKIEEIEKEERELTGKAKTALENKVKDHNEEIKELDLDWNAKVTLNTLEKVFDRGIGAYKTNPGSVRPSVSSPEQWAMARVNSFLYALKKGKYRGGKHDTDLLPSGHPVKEEMEEKHLENMEKELRDKVGTMVTDGIELPLYETIEEAEAEAEKLGGSGHHEHTVYMPFETHEQAKEVMGKMNMNEHTPYHDEEEKSEIRTNPNAEVRTFDVQDLELRMDGDKPTVVGYGAVFNSESNDLGGFREFIAPGAFEGRLEDDVRFLVNHDANLILARTTNGTLRLSVDEKGLRYEADMPNTSTARDLMELLKNGTISQSSFAFTVEEDSWEVKDGMNIRTIDKVSQLYDVSSVTYPAYNAASSSVALRSMKEWQEKEEAKKLEESLEAEKLEGIKEEEDLKKRSLNEMRLKILKNKY